VGEFGPPDTSEKAIRFGCGFVVGLMVAVSALLEWADAPVERWVIAGLVVAAVCGWLAMRHGEGYWESLAKWLWFWP